MRHSIFILFLLAPIAQATAFPPMEYEAGPGIYAPLGGWSKTLGAGPMFSFYVVQPWRPKVAFAAELGFLQLRGKDDPELRYQGIPVVLRAGYRLLLLRSGQEIWAWAGGGFLRSQASLAGGRETSSDPLAELGLSGSIPIAKRLRLALDAKFDEAFALREHGRGVSLSLGLRFEQ